MGLTRYGYDIQVSRYDKPSQKVTLNAMFVGAATCLPLAPHACHGISEFQWGRRRKGQRCRSYARSFQRIRQSRLGLQSLSKRGLWVVFVATLLGLSSISDLILSQCKHPDCADFPDRQAAQANARAGAANSGVWACLKFRRVEMWT